MNSIRQQSNTIFYCYNSEYWLQWKVTMVGVVLRVQWGERGRVIGNVRVKDETK